MASETVDEIDWSQLTPTLMGSTPELHVLHGVNATYKSKDLLQQPGLARSKMEGTKAEKSCAGQVPELMTSKDKSIT